MKSILSTIRDKNPKNPKTHYETPLYACGSFTLEAAIILPLMAGFMVLMLFFFRVIQVERSVQVALVETGRTLAVQASLDKADSTLGEFIGLAEAEVIFRSQIKENDQIQTYVSGEGLGISLLGSDLSQDPLFLRADYRLKLPIGFFQIKSLPIIQESSHKKWTGINKNALELKEWVYITESGTVYHRDRNCRALSINIMETSYADIGKKRNLSRHRYAKCTFCCGKKEDLWTVFYTDQGEYYHAKVDCLALKRTIKMIPIDQVGGRRACFYCGGETEDE